MYINHIKTCITHYINIFLSTKIANDGKGFRPTNTTFPYIVVKLCLPRQPRICTINSIHILLMAF